MNFDAIIIGGGLGGLTAGATLSRFGKKVLLLEQHYISGGCATSFKRKDYIMEVGLHEMDGLHEFDSKCRIFDFLGVWDNIDFKQVPELYRIKGNGFDMVVPHGKSAYFKQLAEAYPEDKEGINNLLNLMEGVLKEVPKLPSGWKSKLMLPLYPILYPNVVKSSKYTLGKWLDENIKSEALKLIIQGNLAYYSDDPYSMSMIYFSVAQSSYIGGGGHFIKGGSQELSNYLAKEIEKGGGQVLLGKKVTNILIQNNKACGVKYIDSFNDKTEAKEVYAPYIIGNAAIPLLKKMLPQPQAEKLGQKIDHLEEACSLISIYIGFNTNLKAWGVKNYSTFLLGDAINSLKDVSKVNKSKDWDKKSFVFVDYSQIDSGLCDENKSVGVICGVDYLDDWKDLSPKAYKKEKERVAQILFKRLDKTFPGITQFIDYYEVGTAKTVQSYTLNPKGTPYGFAQTPEQSGNNRLPAKSPINNLYFASAWSNPGGGFTGAIIGGFLTGLAVSKKLKNSINPKRISDERVVELIERKEIADDTFELIMDKPKNFNYQAGQYAILSINNPTHTKLDLPHRPLSLVSHPDESTLRFAMRSSESSFKQSCLSMKKGGEFTVYGPMGNFTVQHSDKPIVFLIGGIGITPVIPLLKELNKKNFDKAIHLFYSNRTKEKAAYHDYLEELNWDNYNYHPIFTSTDGRLNEEKLSVLNNMTQYDYYIVGTSSFLKTMLDLLKQKNIDASQIFYDDFG